MVGRIQADRTENLYAAFHWSTKYVPMVASKNNHVRRAVIGGP
jgi:hypothetical protein